MRTGRLELRASQWQAVIWNVFLYRHNVNFGSGIQSTVPFLCSPSLEYRMSPVLGSALRQIFLVSVELLTC